MSSIVRTMARSIARDSMTKEGYTKGNHGKASWSEFFSRNWRLFASYRPEKKRRTGGVK